MSHRFGLFRVRSPLLTESRLLSSPGGNEMFQFPPFAPHAYGFSGRSFGHPGIDARLTAPPGLSQVKTYTLLCMCCTGNVSIVLRCLSSTTRRGIWGALQTLLEPESDRPKSCATCEYVSKAIQASLRFSSLLRVDHQASCAPFEMGHRDPRWC